MAYKTVPFLKASKGLNVIADPVRIVFDAEKGVVDLATAYNIDVDTSGRISRRTGQTLKGAWASHSIFAEDDVCFFVSGTALYQLNTDYTRTGIRSGLTPNLKMYFAKAKDRVYYANGQELGYVLGGVSHYWEADTYVGPATTRVFSGPPAHITMLEVYKGRIYAVVDDVLWHSEPFAYGWFDLARNFKQFKGSIRFVKAAYGATDRDADGLYVGTDSGVEFLEGDNPDTMTREQVSDSPPVIGTAVRCEAARVAGPAKTGKVVIWTAQNGIWVGGANGQADCVTKDRLKYPSALYGAGVYHNGKYIVLLQE
jgi:hypothetical protein